MRNDECSHTPVRTAGSASSRITAATPPTNSDTGFLKTRHDTDDAGTSAASPVGYVKSMAGPPSAGQISARAAVSSQGRTRTLMDWIWGRSEYRPARVRAAGEDDGVPGLARVGRLCFRLRFCYWALTNLSIIHKLSTGSTRRQS